MPDDWRLRLPQRWSPKGYDQLWRTARGEVRGEPLEGQVAFVWVVFNRANLATNFKREHGKVHPLYGDGTLEGVCDDPMQFSCWNKGTSSRTQGLAALAGAMDNTRVMEVAAACLLGDHEPPFGPEVTHYHVATDPYPPGWKPKPLPAGWVQPQPVRIIGKHAFYSEPH